MICTRKRYVTKLIMGGVTMNTINEVSFTPAGWPQVAASQHQQHRDPRAMKGSTPHKIGQNFSERLTSTLIQSVLTPFIERQVWEVLEHSPGVVAPGTRGCVWFSTGVLNPDPAGTNLATVSAASRSYQPRTLAQVRSASRWMVSGLGFRV